MFLVGLLGGMVAYHHERRNNITYLDGTGITLRDGGGIVRQTRSLGRFGIAGSNSQDTARGVITSVNGTNFTVAGNGSTQQVSTSSSTQYQGGDQVKVNDSVVAYGTTNNGTLSATQVVINP